MNLVKIKENNIRSREFWLKVPILATKLRPWLIDSSSLTLRLQKRFGKFVVMPVAINYAKLTQDEAVLLSQPYYKIALIRDVLLMGDNYPVVFAHSILPKPSFRGSWNKLSQLGNKPLGATLFANPKVKRTPLRFKKITSNHLIYKRATQHLLEKPNYLWARRSIFSLNCTNIMVTEVFLSQIAG